MDDDLQPFVETFLPRLTDRDGQTFQVALQGIWIYRDYLGVIQARFLRDDRKLRASYVRSRLLPLKERLALIPRQRRYQTEVFLQIESFYLFAKILLDKVARFLQYFFGQIRAKPLTSHDDLSRELSAYVAERGLELPNRFQETVVRLRRDISDFRDHFIAHEQSPRTSRSLTWHNDEPGRLTLARIYGKPSEQQALSMCIPDLAKAVEAYLALVRELVAANFDRTALRKRDRQAGG